MRIDLRCLGCGATFGVAVSDDARGVECPRCGASVPGADLRAAVTALERALEPFAAGFAVTAVVLEPPSEEGGWTEGPATEEAEAVAAPRASAAAHASYRAALAAIQGGRAEQAIRLLLDLEYDRDYGLLAQNLLGTVRCPAAHLQGRPSPSQSTVAYARYLRGQCYECGRPLVFG